MKYYIMLSLVTSIIILIIFANAAHHHDMKALKRKLKEIEEKNRRAEWE